MTDTQIQAGYAKVKAKIKQRIANNSGLEDVPDQYYLFNHIISKPPFNKPFDQPGWNIPNDLPLPHRCMLVSVIFNKEGEAKSLWTASDILTESDRSTCYKVRQRPTDNKE